MKKRRSWPFGSSPAANKAHQAAKMAAMKTKEMDSLSSTQSSQDPNEAEGVVDEMFRVFASVAGVPIVKKHRAPDGSVGTFMGVRPKCFNRQVSERYKLCVYARTVGIRDKVNSGRQLFQLSGKPVDDLVIDAQNAAKMLDNGVDVETVRKTTEARTVS